MICTYTGGNYVPQEMINLLEGDADVECFKVQLCMLHDLIKTELEGTIKK